MPYYLDGGADWLAAMQALLGAEQFDLVIPCEERSLLPLHLHRDVLEPLARLAIPDTAGIANFFDKERTRALAQQCNVPVAAGRVLDRATTASALATELGLPLIVKPRHSYDWPELYVRTSARLLDSHAALDAWLDQHRDALEQYLAEQVFPGHGLGVSVLCAAGTVVLAFEHERVHEEFGSSFYRRSVPLHPARLAALQSMAAVSRYTGLAMFEFKENRTDGNWILLEVNARPWGSMPLPVSLGVDFPMALYRLQVLGEAPVDRGYVPDRYCRNLLNDFWQLRKSLARQSLASAAALRAMAAWAWSFRRILIGHERNDLWVRDDTAPAWRELRDFLRDRLDGLRSRLLGPRPSSIAITPGRVRRVLFVCQGNICRSPYAEHRLHALLGPDSGIHVQSAGMLPRNRRPSPPQAISAAASRGLDLLPHRSQVATDAMVEGADLILVFDRINVDSLHKRHPDAMAKTRLLDGSAEIADPDGKDISVFTTTYQHIDTCMQTLVAELAPGKVVHA
ncbi:hypothetical protein ASF44_08665 [Pseudorhodoferax sp. Leaf274]|nr:hypothetical protein ASF44_08665 [Pseudorhodoferax sp. Leaf274]